MPWREKRSQQRDSGGKFTKVETTGRLRDKYLKAAIKAIKENGQRRGAAGEEIVQLALVDDTLKKYRQNCMLRALRAAVLNGKLVRSKDGRYKLPHPSNRKS